MFMAVQQIIAVQITQQGTIMVTKLNKMKEDLDLARAEYADKLAQVVPRLKETQDQAKARYEDLVQKYQALVADGAMLEVRKDFLADISKIEAEVATSERLAKRVAAAAAEMERTSA